MAQFSWALYEGRKLVAEGSEASQSEANQAARNAGLMSDLCRTGIASLAIWSPSGRLLVKSEL